jgi:Peroxiredoxin
MPGTPLAKKKPLTGKADAAAGQSALTEGARAPAFRLPRDGGDTVSLSDYSGKKLVLFFYPRADTPGCTREAIDFTRLAGAFAQSRTAILGVSADSPKTQEAFRDKHRFPFLLFRTRARDAGGLRRLGRKIHVWQDLPGHSSHNGSIGADGRIIKIWRNVKVDGHAEAVLAAARGS